MNVNSSLNVATIRKFLETGITVVIVLIAFWNIFFVSLTAIRMPAREAEDVTVLEGDYAPVRQILIDRGYRDGPVDIINPRVLKGEPNVPGDDGRWSQAQYVMVPWVLVGSGGTGVNYVRYPSGAGTAPFVVGDFWDAAPEKIPPDLIKLHQGPRIWLFERKRQ